MNVAGYLYPYIKRRIRPNVTTTDKRALQERNISKPSILRYDAQRINHPWNNLHNSGSSARRVWQSDRCRCMGSIARAVG